LYRCHGMLENLHGMTDKEKPAVAGWFDQA
jgi:hypothetical protein